MEQTLIFIGMYAVSILLVYIILFRAYEIDYFLSKYENDVWIPPHTVVTDRRYKRPVWFHIILIIAVCIPILNIIVSTVVYVITYFNSEEYEYKSFLNKRI